MSATTQIKGPASAATDPDHGSSILTKGKMIVNMNANITEHTGSATERDIDDNFATVCELHTAASQLRVCWTALTSGCERDALLEDVAHILDNQQQRIDELAESLDRQDTLAFQASLRSCQLREYLSPELCRLLDAADAIIAQCAATSDDDLLAALSDFSSMIATRAAADENKQAYGILAANAPLSDEVALFHGDHGNLASAPSTIDGANVALAVAQLRAQKSLDGLALNLAPAYLVVGPAREVAARQLLAAITATKASDVNVWSGFAELIVDAEITGNAWYLFANPGAAPTVVYGYVAGSEGPQVRTERDFDTQAVKVAAGLDFAAGAIDFRGAVKNAGA